MKANAKVTSHMAGCPDDIWIIKGKTYELKRLNDPEPNLYFFIDEQGDDHYLDIEDFDEYFEEVV